MDNSRRSSAPVLFLLGSALCFQSLAGCNLFTVSSQEEGTKAELVSTSESVTPPGARDSVAHSPAVGVFTYHNNLARTGLNANETTLTPANVNSQSFGKLFTTPVDGHVYAQPLYAPYVAVPGNGTHNIVYVATQNDSVYAFDADGGGPPIWQASLLEGGTPVPSSDYQCDQIVPQVGITGTPVIDPETQTLYVVASVKHDSESGPGYAHRLHALDIATGAEKFGGPVSITGSVPGIGEGQIRGTIAFDPFPHLNRAGLALANGIVYVAFGSHCDMNWFHGWVFAYSVGSATTRDSTSSENSQTAKLALRAVFNTTPNGFWGSIWQSGAAPAIDADGHVFVATGNGTFRGADYGDTFLKLMLRGHLLRAIDYFTPFNQKILDEQDVDLGASGPVLLPTQPGPHPHLMVGTGKSGTIYLVDRDRMGRFVARGKDRQIVQVIRGAIGGNYGTPAYWNGRVYFGSFNDSVKAFSLVDGRLSPTPASQTANVFGYPGVTPSISADDTKNGIVWALQNDEHYRSGPAVLRAYDATDLSRELYSSASDSSGNAAGPAVKFTSPTIANGKVYVGTQNSLDVYGLQQ